MGSPIGVCGSAARTLECRRFAVNRIDGTEDVPMPAMSHNLELGRRGEDAAEQWYRHAGYQILHRNWRCEVGELDLVVTTGAVVAFVEVKTRSSARFGTGAEAVGYRKQQKVRAVARCWLAESSRHYGELRFDVVDVDARGQLVVYEGCF